MTIQKKIHEQTFHTIVNPRGKKTHVMFTRKKKSNIQAHIKFVHQQFLRVNT